jgi:hypothetical protein
MTKRKAPLPFVPRSRLPGEAKPATHNIFADEYKPAPAPPIRTGACDFLSIKSRGTQT